MLKRIIGFSLLLFCALLWWKYQDLSAKLPVYSQVIYDRNGLLFDAFLAADDKWRFKADSKRLGERYLAATLCLEDKRFAHHPGIDPISMVRALGQNLQVGHIVSGGSTITMQLARLMGRRSRKLRSKILEAIDAVFIEIFWSKQEILNKYFALIPFGHNIEGVEAASHILLQKPIGDASYAEIATLLLLPQKPSRLQSASDLDWQMMRNRNLVRLAQCGLLNAVELENMVAEPVRIPRAKWFEPARHVSRFLASKGQAEIATLLDRNMQIEMEALMQRHQNQLLEKGISDGVMLIVDNVSGDVLAAVGNFPGDHPTAAVNAMLTPRSTGSTLKPLIYAIALEQGLILPESLVQDVPVEFSGYVPENYDDNFRGLVQAEDALSESLNIPFITLLHRVGLDHFLSELETAGVKRARAGGALGLSAAVGALAMTPLDLAKIYLAFARDGRQSHLRFLQSDEPQKEIPWRDNGAMKLMGQALSKQQRREQIDPGLLLYGKEPIRWKTGTSQGRRDAWAVGYDSQFTVLVWLGNLDMRPSSELVGNRASGPILFQAFDLLGKRVRNTSERFLSDNGLTEVEVCAFSGFKPGISCPRKTVVGLASRGLNRTCPYHEVVEVDVSSGLQVFPGCRDQFSTRKRLIKNLPAKVRDWYRYSVPSLAIHPECRKPSNAESSLAILQPRSDTTYYLPEGEQQLRLPLAFRLVKNRQPYCFLNGKPLPSARAGSKSIQVPPGVHRIYCQDELAHATEIQFKVSRF